MHSIIKSTLTLIVGILMILFWLMLKKTTKKLMFSNSKTEGLKKISFI